ncbi:hypothetical protein KL86DPRO_10338 [uncultured delta proteobacterium]|uniref:Uncharacterized protein n=1 Tax=uncultured delta proteobacterium TaxID=34034 RepID=A0A212IYM0_9DELT|nr:hypothetical protein KL86DPRO_10338 [uncultured delta proteobacterium]
MALLLESRVFYIPVTQGIPSSPASSDDSTPSLYPNARMPCIAERKARHVHRWTFSASLCRKEFADVSGIIHLDIYGSIVTNQTKWY